MSKHIERGDGDSRYFVRFSVAALLLLSTTLVLVFVVLPQRYVFSSGFVESALSFPDAQIPFVPIDAVQIAAQPTEPDEPVEPSGEEASDVVVRGPAEIFWERVLPLIEARRYDEALALFDEYLRDYPGDRDVRVELARTLVAAGRLDDAVSVLEELLREADEPRVRLLLARTLRDMGRPDAASVHYDAVLRTRPDDESLRLEWARALAWYERYDEAERVLLGALDREPRSVPVRVELARVYYYAGRLLEAQAILDGLTDAELAAAGALGLREAVRRALEVPPHVDPDPPPLTLLEQALMAREADDFERARVLFERALSERPDDPEIWLAYADFLEYELNDYEGALQALLEVVRLSGSDARLQHRIAALEIWTGRGAAAAVRLRALLALLDSETALTTQEDGAPPVTTSDVVALLGDLHRWDGQRVRAAEEYQRALAEDPANPRALEGLTAIRVRVARLIDEAEDPRMGSRTLGLGDTDDFGRVDLSGEWIGVRDVWVWSGAGGSRWLTGRDLTAASASHQGMYVEASPARWWRWGTIRTGLHLGAESVRPGHTDVSYGATVQYRDLGGSVVNAEYRHEPAYTIASTLQSVDANLVQDRVRLSLDRALDERWNLTVRADVSQLDPRAFAGADESRRTEGTVSVSRLMSDSWRLGMTTQALTYSEAAPMTGGLPLFWDPESVYAVGPYAQVRKPLTSALEASLRVNPGLAWIDERVPTGSAGVPQLSADLRLAHEGRRWHSAVELFYSQARLQGYRVYGLRLSFGTSSWLSDEVAR